MGGKWEEGCGTVQECQGLGRQSRYKMEEVQGIGALVALTTIDGVGHLLH